MAAPTAPSDAQLRAVAALVRQYGGPNAAWPNSGLTQTSFYRRWARARDKGFDTEPLEKPFDVEPLPDELPTAEELLARRRKQFDRKRTAKDARKLVKVDVRVDGPVGLAFVGDPHVDDDGTDIALLEEHVAIFKANDALLPLAIGDYSNNWIGRLARLYGQQSMSAAEAWVLVEWLVRALPWVVLVGGNHDLWSGDGDPIKWMAKSARVNYEANGIRLGIHLPSGREIRVNARHDFSGKSQWNTAFGPAKAAQMGWRDHILTAGHTHVSGIQVVRDPMSGLISHCLRIGSYKTHDRYADERGLPNQNFAISPVVVVRPQFEDSDNRLLTTFFEPGTASEFLTWLRGRKSERGV